MKTIKRIISKIILKNKYQSLALSQSQFLQVQRENFETLKSELDGTDIYNDLGMDNIFTYEQFIKEVSVRGYDEFKPYIDRLIDGEKNVLFNNNPLYFGLTSGTSGKDSKKIPYNKQMIATFKDSQQMLASVVNEMVEDIDLVNSARLTYGSNPETYEHNGISYGYISGILSAQTPYALKNVTFPTNDILAIENWEQKLDKLSDQVIPIDIKVASGIPSYLISIFEYVLEKTGKKEIKEVWPNLETVIYGATLIDPYRDRLNTLVGKKLNYFGIYAATEAPLGISINNARDEKQIYAFHPKMLFTFTDVDDLKRTIGVGEIEEGKSYFVNTSASNGFVNYTMKDIIRIKSVEPILTFEILGRMGSGINLAAEKTSDEHVLDSVLTLNKKLSVNVDHYFLCPSVRKGIPCYQWTIFSDELKTQNEKEVSVLLDAIMSEQNEDYFECREDNILSEPIVKIVSPIYLKDYFNANKDRGQFKMKTVFSCPETFTEFIAQAFPALLGNV